MSKTNEELGLDDAAYAALYGKGYRPQFPKNVPGGQLPKSDTYRRKHYAAYLAGQGQSIAKIAEATNVNPKTVSAWVKQADFKQLASLMEVHATYDAQTHDARLQMARLEETRSSIDSLVALTKLRQASVAAVQALEDIVKDPDVDPRWRIEASTRILDRMGLPAQHDLVVSGGVTHTVQEMSVEAALKALGAEDGYLEPTHDLKQLQDGEYEAELVTTTDSTER